MSLMVFPVGQSRVTSATVNAPVADQVIASLAALPAGWYLITLQTASNAAFALGANLKLVIGGSGSTSELGRLSSQPAGADLEFVTWIQSNATVAVLAVVADPAGTYSVQHLTATEIVPPNKARNQLPGDTGR
jgi:hypothetical protein